MKTPITYYGGKQTLVKYLLALIPPHKLYCEPFFGGGALFFAKPPSPVEVINDNNGEVVNFFRVMKMHFHELKKHVEATPHSRLLFKKAQSIYKNGKEHSIVERAWAFWTLANQGFSGGLTSWGFGKENSKEVSLSRKRDNFSTEYAERLKTVQIECNDALKVIDRCDSKDTFFYVDPPYFNSNMGHYKGYTEEDYKLLLDKLSKVKGKFLLSSYPSEILKKYIKQNNWHYVSVTKHIAVTKHTDKKKTEMMVFNYDVKNMGALSGTKKSNGKKDYSDITTEIKFIERFLSFDNKVLYRNTFRIFIDQLQEAIKTKSITKKSPVAKEIVEIQNACIKAHNKLEYATHFVLKPETIKRLKGIIAKYESDRAKGDEPTPDKIDPMDLSGLNASVASLDPVLCSTEFSNMKFASIGFTGKWLDLIGDPSKGFTAMVYGLPKMGKSYLCLDFATYLAKTHGKVLYVAAEEKLDATLQKKVTDLKASHPNLFVSGSVPQDLSAYDFIFLDSVNNLGLTAENLKELKAKNQGKSFVFIFQTTKDGKFRGANTFQHDVDIVIEIPERGKAVQFGRFNQGGEMQFFDKQNLEGISHKNWTKSKHLKEQDHQDLQYFKDLYEQGKFKEALKYANNLDTIVREEIPVSIWKKVGGNLTEKGEDILKKEKRQEIETEFVIPLQELAFDVVPKEKNKAEIIEITHNEPARVEKVVEEIAKSLFKKKKLNISVKKVTFTANDRNNISTGAAYFTVVLEGEAKDLKKVAGEDSHFLYEW